MGIPACLWRRTGEIYKANREFAELVGVDNFMLRNVRIPNPNLSRFLANQLISVSQIPSGPFMHL